MKDELLLIAVLFFGYVFLFGLLLPALLPPEPEKPYGDLYKNNEKYSFQEGKVSNGGVASFVEIGAGTSVSYTLKRKTVWGYIETSNNNFPYLFKTILLPRKLYGIDFNQVHKWFFRVILILTGLTAVNELIKKEVKIRWK